MQSRSLGNSLGNGSSKTPLTTFMFGSVFYQVFLCGFCSTTGSSQLFGWLPKQLGWTFLHTFFLDLYKSFFSRQLSNSYSIFHLVHRCIIPMSGVITCSLLQKGWRKIDCLWNWSVMHLSKLPLSKCSWEFVLQGDKTADTYEVAK